MKLTEHFTSKEFACHCCQACPAIDPRLLDGLEDLRVLIGNRPIQVVSGFRCEKHNQQVGGAPKSYHLKGMAADIKVEGMSSEELFEACTKIPVFHGLGRYISWVHVDVRDKKAAWMKK